MSLFRNNSYSSIGVSVTHEEFHAVQLKKYKHGYKIFSMLKLPRLHNADGQILELDESMLNRFKKALDTNGFYGLNLILGVPGNDLLSSMIELPPINGDIPIEQIAKMEMSRIHHCDADDFELASWLLPQPERSNKSNQVIASIYKHDKANALLDLFESVGFHINTIDIMPQALARACEMAPGIIPSKIILHHTYDGTHLIAVDNNTIIYERRIPDLGFGKLINLVQSKFNIEDLKTAVRLIKQIGFEDGQQLEDDQKYEQSAAVRKMINEHYQKILQELGNAQSYTKQQYSQMSDQEICLTGGASDITGWRDIIEKALNTKTHMITPCMLFEPDTYLKESPQIFDPGFISSIGLACYNMKGVYREAS